MGVSTDGGGPAAIITGAGSGIGRAAAALLSARGWRVALAGRRPGPLGETAAMLAGESLTAPTDVGDDGDVRRLVERTVAQFGRVDALINNAGYAPLLPLEETGPDVIRETFAINALGPAYAIRAVWPTMRSQGGGRIVNVSSMSVVDPFPGFFAYAGSKAALGVFAVSCAREGEPYGIRCFTVAPGAVETPMLRAHFDESSVPAEKCLTPDEVAGVIVACAVGERDGENGRTIMLRDRL